MGEEDPLKKEMATHSSHGNPFSIAWEIPWTEEAGGLPSIGSQRVGHELATNAQQYNKNGTHALDNC